MQNVTVVDHPLAQHFVARLRDRRTMPDEFRVLTKRLTVVLAVEALRDLRTAPTQVDTPLETTNCRILDDPLVAVAILRAGLGMLDPIVDLCPDVSVGYIGLERNEATAVASSYYAKLPPNIAGKTVLLLDPMLATGGSASQACDVLARHGSGRIVMLAVVAAPEGIDVLTRLHPNVRVITVALDRMLNDKSYILPGLGDFGDRLYGT